MIRTYLILYYVSIFISYKLNIICRGLILLFKFKLTTYREWRELIPESIKNSGIIHWQTMDTYKLRPELS